MKKKYYIIFNTTLFAIAALCLTSCVKDDLSDCVDSRGNVRLTVKLDAKAMTVGLEDYQIDSTHVYVFDDNNEFVTFAAGGVYDPTQEYELFFTLEQSGDYNFIVWTNPGQTYQTNYTVEQCYRHRFTPGQLQYYMSVPEDKLIAQDIDDMLYGATKQEIISHINNTVVVELNPNNYRVNVKVKGLPATDNDFEFTITDNNSHYNFENTITRENIGDFTYIRHASQQEDEESGESELNVSFEMLRLLNEEEDSHTPRFALANATLNNPLYSDNLIAMIRRAYGQSGQALDFEKTHAFDIVLIFDTNMGVTVSINGWEYSPQPGELG